MSLKPTLQQPRNYLAPLQACSALDLLAACLGAPRASEPAWYSKGKPPEVNVFCMGSQKATHLYQNDYCCIRMTSERGHSAATPNAANAPCPHVHLRMSRSCLARR
jgi:hypothetical protein